MEVPSVRARLDKLRSAMDKKNLDALFVSNAANVSYMSNYTNSDSFLFIGGSSRGSSNIFITDSRYFEQAGSECPDYEIVLHRNGSPALEEHVARLCEKHGIGRLAFEGEYTSYARYQKIRSALPGGVEFYPSEKLIENLRMVKNEYELSCLRTACEKTDRVFERLCQFIRPGVTERDIEWELLSGVRAQGCDPGAHPIVVSGVRGSLPHGVAEDKQVKSGEFVTMDFGCMYRGYRADMTRTVFVGRPDEKQNKIYDTVLQANLRAQARVKNGAVSREVDAAARNYIVKMGYGEYFGHGLGHGVGLDIHELPFMNPSSEEVLLTGCVITVEPGIYLPGWGGVRIEDTVIVTDNGCEPLFSSPKKLICL